MTDFAKDDIVRVRGEGGLFKVMKVRPNGDVDVYGGTGFHVGDTATRITGHATYRTFEANRLRKAKK